MNVYKARNCSILERWHLRYEVSVSQTPFGSKSIDTWPTRTKE